MNIYYKINESIMNNYDNKNRNYEILYYLNQFQNNNNIINDLIEIIESQSILNKFNKTFNIYRKMNIDEITLIYNSFYFFLQSLYQIFYHILYIL